MAAYLETLRSPYVAGDFLRPADDGGYDNALFGDDYVSPTGANAYGRQSSFDILTDGSPSRGLRVTLTRDSGRQGDESNGYAVTIAVGSSRIANVSDSNKTVGIRLTASTTMAQIKVTIDASADLSSEYFGGEAGAGATDAQEVADTSNGVADQWSFIIASPNGGALLFIGLAAPSSDAPAKFLRADQLHHHAMPPGHSAFFKRIGTSNVRGGWQIWRGPVNG